MKNLFSKPLYIYGIIVFIISFFICLGFGVNGLELSSAFKLIAVQMFVIILPGAACLLLLNPGIKDFCSFFAVSYALGYALSIILYFGCRLIRWVDGLLPFYVVIAILSMLLLFRKRHMIYALEMHLADLAICIAMMAALCSLLFITYCANHLLPVTIGGNDYYNDDLTWMGNSIELTLEFPPMIFTACTRPLYYHYFSSIPMAVAELLTKVPAIYL